jgi:hypothetical protein
MNMLHNFQLLLNKTCYTKILINYGNIVFFVRCMTYFKKLSNFELLCLNFSPNT